MKTSFVFKLGPWTRPGWTPEPDAAQAPSTTLPPWASRAAWDLVNRMGRVGGVWIHAGTPEADAVTAAVTMATGRE